MHASRTRRVVGAVVALALAAAGVIGLIALFSSRDSSTFSAARGPGRTLADAGDRHLAHGQSDPAYATNPPTTGAHVVVAVHQDGGPLSNDQLLTALEQGNVVLAYRTDSLAPALRSLAAGVSGGPFDPAVAAAGQAVILDRRAAVPAGKVIALAWDHELPPSSATDPAVRAFAQYWLGRGAPAGGG